ncbi:meteorin [Danio aesculapii]|uniref:meteorin n=1 Tax=Danio aesculapii TaxID=1142201 RepID=UPI0024C071C1|nr:meteorin [Danio aesculapii]
MEIWGFRSFALWISFLTGLSTASYSEDQCSWRGSGLSQAVKNVEQVWLRCAEGSVEWLYPAGALRLTLSPRLPWSAMGPGESSRSPVSVCVKPDPHWGGAQLHLERDGVLELLVGDETSTTPGPAHVRCFSALPGERPALFLQATPHRDISRRIAAFRYELRGDWTAQPSINTDPVSSEGACRPCNNTEILMAVCTSDFVVRGNIRSVGTDSNLKAAVIKVSATRVYRQKFALFPESGRLTRSGEIRTPLQCGVRPGAGSFLFTGRVHFGEAWLGCAPRYKDFLKAYEQAKQSLMIPCTLVND